MTDPDIAGVSEDRADSPARGLPGVRMVALVGLVCVLAAGAGAVGPAAAQDGGDLTIESVNGEDPGQVNEVTYTPDDGFAVTIDGVDPEEWAVYASLDGDRVSTELDGRTVVVISRPHDFEPGQYTLTVTARDDADEVSAETEIRITDVGSDADADSRTTVGPSDSRNLSTGPEDGDDSRPTVGPSDSRNRSTGPNRTLRVEETHSPYGLAPEPTPTQHLRFDLEFVEQAETAIQIDMAGDRGLPEGIEVTSVSADGPWPTDATTTDRGVRVAIDGREGPETGTLSVTVEFDASEVYEEGVDPQRGIRYGIEDGTGDRIGLMGVLLWARPVWVAIEKPTGERLAPDTDRENWREAWKRGTDAYDPDYEVLTGDGSGYESNSSYRMPEADGLVQLVHDPERVVRVRADGYADPVVDMSEIDPEAHRWRDDPYVVHLSEGGAVRLTLADEDGEPFPDGTVEVTDADGVRYTLDANDDGVVKTSLKPGTYSGWAGAHTALPEPDLEFAVSEGAVTEQRVELRTPEVVTADVEHVGGTAPDLDAMEVDALYYDAAMLVALKPTSADDVSRRDVADAGLDTHLHDLAALGVDETTELRLTLEIESFDPDVLVWAARDTRWEIVDEREDSTVVAIETKATDLQQIDAMHTGFGSGDRIDWPSGDADVADTQYDAVVNVLLFDVDAIGGQGDVVEGLSVTSNAQVFSVPTFQDRELSVYAAAPHETVAGDAYTGYYQAYLPDSLLAEWNVDDPERDLAVTWIGEPTAYEVTDVEGGVYVEIEPIHYSEGTMAIRSTASASPLDRVPWRLVGVGVALAGVLVVSVLLRRR